MLVGVVELDKKLAKLADEETIQKALKKACARVMADAIVEAPADTGELRQSITYEVEGNVGAVGTNLFYAPYVHQGTGEFARDGNGREGYWVFVKGSSNGESSAERKIYTLDQARQIVAIMRSKGLDAYYTHGQMPNPFLERALDKNRLNIAQDFKDAIEEAVKND
jgi:HK97 gp10 family phage protein